MLRMVGCNMQNLRLISLRRLQIINANEQVH